MPKSAQKSNDKVMVLLSFIDKKLKEGIDNKAVVFRFLHIMTYTEVFPFEMVLENTFKILKNEKNGLTCKVVKEKPMSPNRARKPYKKKYQVYISDKYTFQEYKKKKERGEKVERVDEIKWVEFKPKKSQLITNDGRACDIPPSSNQFVLCRKVFEIPKGDWLKRIEIKDDFFSDSGTGFYNAVRAINKKSLERLNIKVLEYSTDKAKVRPEIQKADSS